MAAFVPVIVKTYLKLRVDKQVAAMTFACKATLPSVSFHLDLKVKKKELMAMGTYADSSLTGNNN